MAGSEAAVPFEAYWKFREEEVSKSFAAQLGAFAERVSQTSRHVSHAGLAENPVERRSITAPAGESFPVRRKFPRQNVFLVKTPPFTTGLPNPEYAIRTSGTAGGGYFNIESFGDPVRGRLSVGVSAGVTRDADWTGGTYYSELPDRWLLGDAITSSASLIQVVNIGDNYNAKSLLYGDVQFGWDPMYPGGFVGTENLLRNALENTPGLKNSALGGFVGVSAVVELTVSLVSEGAVLSSGQASQTILELGIDAEFYGDTVQDQVPAPYLFLNFAFSNNPWNMIGLRASAPYRLGAKQLIVETMVRLVGARGGVNDPNAGYVTAAFQDIYEGASPVSDVPFAPNPFFVGQINTFSATG